MTSTQMEETLQALGKTIDALVRGVAQSKANSDRYIWLRDTATKEQIEEFANYLRRNRDSFIDAERKAKP